MWHTYWHSQMNIIFYIPQKDHFDRFARTDMKNISHEIWWKQVNICSMYLAVRVPTHNDVSDVVDDASKFKRCRLVSSVLIQEMIRVRDHIARISY